MKRTFASGFSTPIILKALLFLAVPTVLAMAVAPRSHAASYDNTKGDFILGFREVGSTTSILVDIGPISNFTTSQSFSLGTLGTLLSSTYGSGWATNPNVYFSLAATSRPEDGTATDNYVTSPEYPADGVAATIWPRLTQTNSNILRNKIINCGDDFNLFAVQSGTNAVLEPSTSTDAYQNFMPGGLTDSGHATSGDIGWGFFNPTPEGSFQDGAAGVVLHLIQLVPGHGSGTDLGKFTLSANGNTLTFTALTAPPTITSFSPTSGKPGDTVVIKGANFVTPLAVYFAGGVAAAHGFTATQINATVPTGALTGPIKVSTNAGSATSAAIFTDTSAPTITSFSPTSGMSGDTVVIKGTNFTAPLAVYFGGGATAVHGFNAIQINAAVPAGAVSGPIKVSTNNGSVSTATSFTDTTPPAISSFSPASGAVGSTVVIKGTGFQAPLTVIFAGNKAAAHGFNATQINAAVPTGALTGPIKVTTNYGSAATASSFTVTP